MKTVSSHRGLSAIHPLWAVSGGRLDLIGEDFPVASGRLTAVTIGGQEARLVRASASRLGFLVPDGLPGGQTPIRIPDVEGETAFVEIGATIATGLYQVDSPVFDARGSLYFTFSGARGEAVPVSIFRLRPGGACEPFVSDLGVACGLAFARDGSCFVGDRSGTIFRVTPSGEARPFASLPPSVAAFHLAVGPDDALYVTAPTLSPRDHVYRVDRLGTVETYYSGFGRPQGLAFDSHGTLYVVEALAGQSGVYRLRADRTAELVLSGAGLVGLAFDPHGGLIVVSNDTAYRLSVPLQPLNP